MNKKAVFGGRVNRESEFMNTIRGAKMSKMSKFEQAIIDGAVAAQKDYSQMTNWWLDHGPEYFITSIVAKHIATEHGCCVFPEASPKKIKKEINAPPKRGPIPKSDSQRFDIVVWQKKLSIVRAIIEVKRAYTIKPLQDDKKKIQDYMKKNPKLVKNGYLLVYTVAKRINTLPNTLSRWAEQLKCTLVGSHIGEDETGEWRWAVGLFKINGQVSKIQDPS